MFHLDTQKTNHADVIEILLDGAFGPNRHARQSYVYRDGIDDITALRFVALEDDHLIGTIRFWPVAIGKALTPAILLGPLGVMKGRQGEGIGAALIDHGLTQARSHGHRICALVGPLDYYGRFGFAPAESRGILMPGEQPHRLLLRELENDALEGVSGDLFRAETGSGYSAASA